MHTPHDQRVAAGASSQGASTPAVPNGAAAPAPARPAEPPFFRSQQQTAPAQAPRPAAPQGLTQAQQAQLAQRAAAPAALAGDRRESRQPTERLIGHVTYCSGARATISTSADNISGASADFWAVGRMISIEVGVCRVVALVYEMRTDRAVWSDQGENSVSVQVELVGEVTDGPTGMPRFKRGVSRYPPMGSIAHRIRSRDLECMHDLGDKLAVEIGTLSQNDDIPATVSVEDMLRRHFAVVGTTGVGKSCAVSLLVRKALEVKPNLRVLFLDPHNEFGHAFPDQSNLLDASTLELPFWLFKFEEIEDIVFRGKPIEAEADILRELIAVAKSIFRDGPAGLAASLARKSFDTNGFSADTPAPYRMADVMKQIEDIQGSLEPRFDRVHLRMLKVRLDSLMNDPRFVFMFGRGGVEDNFAQVLARLFRLPAEGKPISIVNLSGLPSDVLNAVVSVLARLAFDVAYASDGGLQVLLVCEEAHRYVPMDANAGFLPTRRAIARIAKEGRKYGCSIAVVTQRPGELDPTILSQCSTVFAMRLANDRDQEIIRSAISDSSASTLSFLSALDTREAIAFGEGVATPMRMKFTLQTKANLPEAAGLADAAADRVQGFTGDPIYLVRRLRGKLVETREPAARGPAPTVASSSLRPATPAAPAATGEGEAPGLTRLRNW
jgi:DNA helicase HerA-like ATPase